MQSAFGLAFVAWLGVLIFTRGREGWRPNPLLWPMLVFVLANVIVLIFSIDRLASLRGVRQLGFMAMILVIGNTATRKTHVQVLAFTWLAAASVISLYAVSQYLNGVDRVHAFFGGPMPLVRILVMVTAIGAALSAHTRGRLRRAALCCLAVTIPALFLTFTRGGWLALCGSAFFLGILKKSKLVLGGVLMVACLAVVLATACPQTKTGGLIRSIFYPLRPSSVRFAESNLQRYWMYRSALSIFCDHPVTGVGQMNFGKVFGSYVLEELRNPYAPAADGTIYTGVAHAHNLYLHLLATGGLLGLVGFLGLIRAAVRLTWRNYQDQNDDFLQALSLGILTAIVAFLTLGLFDENFRDSISAMQLWFLLGLAAAIHRLSRAREAPVGGPSRRPSPDEPAAAPR
jgi:O-antigen ligase